MIPRIEFILYVFVVAFTPGPNNIMSMNNAAQKGFRKALPFNLGILAGTTVVMLLCAAFSGLLFTLVPRIQLPMKLAGAAYMLYLAVKTLLPSKESKPRKAGGSFISGAVLQLINPKIIIYGVTALSTYVLPASKSAPVLAGFAFLLALVGFTSTLCWAAAGSILTGIFDKHGKAANLVMSLLLLYCAVSLFL